MEIPNKQVPSILRQAVPTIFQQPVPTNSRRTCQMICERYFEIIQQMREVFGQSLRLQDEKSATDQQLEVFFDQ